MNVLLINPILNKKNYEININEPLGLEYLAAIIQESHKAEIVDGLINGLTEEQIINKIKEFSPNLIGISLIYSIAIKDTENIIKIIKNNFPHIPIVLGGNVATFLYKEFIKNPLVDFIVLGEGEITFKELIEAIENKLEFSEIKGLVYKKDNEPIVNPLREIIKDLDKLPLPAHNILENKRLYQRTVITSRGCPYRCIYCTSTSFWKSYRTRSVRSVIKEIQNLYTDNQKYSNDTVVFMDDTFTVDNKRVVDICNELLLLSNKLGFKILWGANSRVEHLNNDLLSIMKKSGCISLFLGIESGSPKILKLLNRNYTPEQVIEIVKFCTKLGIKTYTSFILGLPFETKEDILLTLDLIKKIPGNSIVYLLTPFPGTEIYNDPLKFKLNIYPHAYYQDNLKKYLWIDNNCINKEEILEFYYKACGICEYKAKIYS